jgi:MoxR-like ATPase
LAEESRVALEAEDDIALADRLRGAYGNITRELRKLIVGQEDALEQVMLSLFVGGNSIITGVPGLAKTLIVHCVAQVLDLKFARIQFTPDLMPSDITGTDLVQEDPQTGRRELVFMPGPIFNNIVLADEINRTPPKTQSALLEAMQEHRVTIQGRTYTLEEPFFVFATQNPIELEGTYPLPEAQLDRFMFNIVMTYLPEDEEVRVVTQTTGVITHSPSQVLSGEEILEIQQLVRQVIVAEDVARYAVRLVDASRPGRQSNLDFVQEWVKWGAGLRASQSLILAGKARALLNGRYHVSVADIRALARPVLRHRIIPNFYAESERVTSDTLIDRLLEAVPTPRSGM